MTIRRRQTAAARRGGKASYPLDVFLGRILWTYSWNVFLVSDHCSIGLTGPYKRSIFDKMEEPVSEPVHAPGAFRPDRHHVAAERRRDADAAALQRPARGDP